MTGDKDKDKKVTKSRTIGAVAIRQWHSEHVSMDVLRKTLLGEGLAKGTVSKIITVMHALREGVVNPEHVMSINKAYRRVQVTKIAQEIANDPSFGVTYRESLARAITERLS